MAKFAVIDTETNWHDAVMSIGAVIADSDSFAPVDSKYYILTPEHRVGGMFASALYFRDRELNVELSRHDALLDLIECFGTHRVTDVFAYNASFDYRHLPELAAYDWYDIMKLAAYRQYNPKIPKAAACYSTGRLKSGYGVEPILRMLSDDNGYCERHNALTDAFDELKIMTLLRHRPDVYSKINA